jgi:hypothetical protein
MTVEELLKSLEEIDDPKARLQHILDVLGEELEGFAASMAGMAKTLRTLPNFPGGPLEGAERLSEQVTGIEAAAHVVRTWIEQDWERGGEGSEDG